MTKIQMPEPVAHAVKAANTGKICSLYTAGDDAAFSGVYLMEKKHVDDLITTDQAESYADARVRGALEEAAKTVMDAPITAGMLDDDGAKALAIHANSRIRDLIKRIA